MTNRFHFRLLLQVLLAALVLNVIVPGVSAANAEEKPGSKRPTVLLILDGYSLREQTEHNAIALADTPVMDRLMKEYPFAQGNASGLADIAPTLIEMMGMEKPAEMTGESLLIPVSAPEENKP